MANLKNTLNEYALAGGYDFFDVIPKSVWAALAVSFATQGGCCIDEAASRIAEEWKVLHENGIVPQPVHKLVRQHLAAAQAERPATQAQGSGQ